MKKRVAIFLLATLSLSAVLAQRSTIFEQVSCYSSTGPIMKYWAVPSVRMQIISSLNEALIKQGYAPLKDTVTQINFLPTLRDDPRRSLPFSNADTATDHFYLELFEVNPMSFYLSQPSYQEDSTLFKRSKTLFHLNVLLLNAKKEKKIDASILMCITESANNGIGIKVPDIAVTGKGFADIIKMGIGMLLTSTGTGEENSLVEIKAPPAFYEDNFILPTLTGHTVYSTSIQKSFFSYSHASAQQIIRMGESFYEELLIRGKNSNIDERSTLGRNILATGRSRSSDFVRLRQECRNVGDNHNYSIQLVVEINPSFPYTSQADVFSYFLAGMNHFLLQDKDTLAVFTISRGEGKPEKRFFPSKVTNGIDSTSVIAISSANMHRSIFYDFSMYGTLKDKSFSVHCGNNGLKEIYYNDTRVIVATGTSLPERFAVFDASLSSETINQLLILAFNRFFQQ